MRSTYVDVDNDLVLVESSLPSAHVQELLQATGKLVLFRGLGSSTEVAVPAAAVAIFRGDVVTGLVRLVQVNNDCCVIEGTVDGLEPGPLQIRVLQYGDLSQGCARCSVPLSLQQHDSVCTCSCGDVLNMHGEIPATGELATVEVDSTGRVEFHCSSEKLKVSDLIGRSLSLRSSTTG